MDGSLEEHKEDERLEYYYKGLLQSNALFQYILDTSVYPVEPEPMKELRKITANHPMSMMITTPDQGQFLMMILKLINAKKTMEIGVFTGYSLLATALALPDDGKILAMDVNRGDYEMGLPVIRKAGVAHKIDFREGPALPLLDQLLADEKNRGTYDFIYVDADKENYWNYHTKLVDLIKVGGVISYDNTLLMGSVAAPPDAPPISEYLGYHREFIMEFNKSIVADPRVEVCLLPVGDGVTLCRRIT